MADQSIRRHLLSLEQHGELIRFDREVDPDENLSAVSWKTFAELGKACLFENVKGHRDWRVASQIVADRAKWGVALGVDEADVVAMLNRRIANTIDPVEIDGAGAPVKQVVAIGKDVDLGRLPAMWTSARDPGRYIASGMCVIKDPATGIRNVSVHRAQILGPDRTGYLICPRQALKIFQMYAELDRPMEAAMVIGAHPAIMFAAAFVAAYGEDEFSIAGGLLGEAIRLVKCETIDMEVPADAELVLEGELHPGERTEEGPFGEVTGTYAQEGSTPLFRIKAVTHRRDPIFYAMQCGLPPSDTNSIICTTIEMKLWDHLTRAAGGIDLLDVRCIGGVTPMLVVVQLKPKFDGQAASAALAALSSPYLHPKFAIAVDADIDASDLNQVFWALANRADAARDVQKISRARVFSLDNASPIAAGQSAMYRVGTKVAIDATAPFSADAASPAPYPFAGNGGAALTARAGEVESAIAGHLANVEGGIDVVAVRCYPRSDNRIVAIKIRPRMEGQSKTALMAALSAPDLSPTLAIAVDPDIDIDDLRDVAWAVASRVHAEVDLQVIGGGAALAPGAPGGHRVATKWFIDATMPPNAREKFERAMPKNLDQIDLAEFLPD